MPPTITQAKGRCVSEPMPVERAAGNSPRPAINAVIRIGRKRSTAPSTIALFTGSPSLIKEVTCSSMTTPFCTEMPTTAIKPTAADTDKCSPASPSAAMPPIMVNGTMARMTAAKRTDLKAANKSAKMPSRATGTMTAKRFIARCWFSNWPPHVMR